MMDEIVVEELRVLSRVGVPEEERAQPQLLRISLRLRPAAGMGALNDQLDLTVDYHDVCNQVTSLAADGERRLIETLAEDIAKLVLDRYPVLSVAVEVKKFILPETSHVAVRIERSS